MRHWPCTDDWTDQAAIWGGELGLPIKLCIRLVSTFAPPDKYGWTVVRGDAACSQSSFRQCCYRSVWVVAVFGIGASLSCGGTVGLMTFVGGWLMRLTTWQPVAEVASARHTGQCCTDWYTPCHKTIHPPWSSILITDRLMPSLSLAADQGLNVVSWSQQKSGI